MSPDARHLSQTKTGDWSLESGDKINKKMAKLSKDDALKYHSQGKPGKIEVVPTKP